MIAVNILVPGEWGVRTRAVLSELSFSESTSSTDDIVDVNILVPGEWRERTRAILSELPFSESTSSIAVCIILPGG